MKANMRRRLVSLRYDMRQRRYRREFRIAPPAWDEEQLGQLERVLAALPARSDPVDSADSADPDTELDVSALCDAATNLWRAHKRLEGSDERLSRQARRYLVNTRDALTDAGLVIQDHDGAKFHPGQALEAVIVQPDPELTVPVVIETVRPSVYFQERQIQMGQVIVGVPGDREPGGVDQHA